MPGQPSRVSELLRTTHKQLEQTRDWRQTIGRSANLKARSYAQIGNWKYGLTLHSLKPCGSLFDSGPIGRLAALSLPKRFACAS
jgi:hypothetical protein